MKKTTTEGRVRAAGFTLVELTISTGLLGLAFGALAMLTSSSQRAYSQGTVSAHLESRIAVTTNRLSSELQSAGAGSVQLVSVGGAAPAELTFRQALGFEDGSVQWSGDCRLVFEYEEGEVADGVDNNGNELVDEGCLVLVTDEGDPTERRRTLTRWVAGLLEGELANGVDDNGNGLIDERGFAVQRTGRALVLSLTLLRRDHEGRSITRTGQTSVRLRN